jgi:hypothetical protein
VLQQDCPRLAQKAAICASVKVKRLQKLDQARGIISELLAGQCQEKW